MTEPTKKSRARNALCSLIPKQPGLPHSIRGFHFQGRLVYYRDNTSDRACIREVIERRCYEREKVGVLVAPGEHWLDLGANIGAFATLALSLGARVTAFEPEEACFELLRRNAQGALLIQSAVTALREPSLPFYGPRNPNDMYRWTTRPGRRDPVGSWKNTHVGELEGTVFDGIKSDIEGAELLMLDERTFPRSRKLAMEYHITRDRDMERFRRHRDFLRERYQTVWNTPALDRPGDRYAGFRDCILFASGMKP